MKRSFIILTCALTLFLLASCGGNDGGGRRSADDGTMPRYHKVYRQLMKLHYEKRRSYDRRFFDLFFL